MANKKTKSRFLQGIYKPVFPTKFVLTKAFDMKKPCIKYRSSWELLFLRFADFSPDIVLVNSEGVQVPYFNPHRQKMSKYYMDFTIQNESGMIFLVEVKPYKETIPPTPPKNKTDKSMANFQKAIMTYTVNKAKWDAAASYAKKHKIKFIIITEYELGLKKR